jgi:two-component system, cell cycle sensor histidine kinase and response regulator CckA
MSEKPSDPNEATNPAAMTLSLRRRAEVKFRAGKPPAFGSLSPEDTQQMLYELQVHQIELEMQNEELRRSRAELEDSRASYFDLYDLAPVGYFTLNENGLIREANLTAATLLGVERHRLVGQPLTRFICPDDQDIHCLHHKKLFEMRARQAFEIRLVKPNGDYFWAQLEATAASAADGTARDRVVISDITERKLTEAALVQEQITCTQQVQAEKLAEMGRVMASVAHELNNPIQTIKNCIYLTNLELTPDSPIHRYLEIATAEGKRLTELVEQLREVSRPRSAGQKQLFNLLPLIETMPTLFASQLAAGGVAWQCTPAVAEAIVSGVRDQLKQVFINISQNALDAMQPIGGTLTIEVVLSANKRQVGIVFHDTGPGIPPEHLDRLFEPFFTTKATGLGLGLAICHDIIQWHGGQLLVESQSGEGAKFTVWLPLSEPEPGSAATGSVEISAVADTVRKVGSRNRRAGD